MTVPCGDKGRPDGEAAPVQRHASAVAVEGRACLITGNSGEGKSTLALEMIALGATLIADDRVGIRRAGDQLLLSAPETIFGLIEARGAGILRLPALAEAPLSLVVDLDRDSGMRLPSPATMRMLGVDIPVLAGKGQKALAALATLILRHGPPVCPDEPVT